MKKFKRSFRELVRLPPSGNNEATGPSPARVSSPIPPGSATVNHRASGSVSDPDLWKLAYQKLQSDENLKLVIEKYEAILRDIVKKANKDPSENNILEAQGLPEQMSLVVQSRIDIMNTKQWKFQWRGKPQTVRNQVNRVVKVIQAISGPLSAAASLNPFAGLAWAGVCVLLPVSIC
jgi:hypothetical protein